MSTLRARCPDCRTLTAVAIGPDYQCHACGREFAAGLVRVGDETLDLPWPEAAVGIAAALPARPVVVGGPPSVHEEVARRLELTLVRPGEPSDGPAYVLVEAPARSELEPLLASLPRPAAAGFSGFRDAETIARLGHALGL